MAGIILARHWLAMQTAYDR